MRRAFAILALALTVLPSLAAAQPDLSTMTPVQIGVLTRAMPKGGELHLHLSGAVFGENFLAWARDDGLCVDPAALALAPPPCIPAKPPASAAFEDLDLYSAMLDSFSVRKVRFRDRSGHDHFFSSFGRFGPAFGRRQGDALAEVMRRAAAQNTFYLELMANGAPDGTQALAASLKGSTDDLRALKAELTPQRLAPLVRAAIAEADEAEARARRLMGCDGPAPDRGCQVTVRYLLYGLRRAPPKTVMAQLMVGAALVRADKRWVGVQMVAPEDEPQAMADYAIVSKIVDVVTDHGQATPVALHAGELTLALVSPEGLRDHVAQAVRVSGARRIGHGSDIAGEDGADALAAQMARDRVLVEVNLSSNRSILEIDADHHPYRWLVAKGVPVSLSTDDPGITRTDLSAEYALAASYGASYADLVTSARNALAFSFLSGAPLWQDAGDYRTPAAVCAGQIGGSKPTGACATLIAGSDKAREQWRYEALLKAFEAGLRP